MAAIFVTMDLDIAMSMASLTNIRYDGQPMQWKQQSWQHNAVQILADGWLNLNFSSGGDQISEVNFYRARWISSLCKLHNRIHHHLHHREETVPSLQLHRHRHHHQLCNHHHHNGDQDHDDGSWVLWPSHQWVDSEQSAAWEQVLVSTMTMIFISTMMLVILVMILKKVFVVTGGISNLHRSESGAVVIWANPRCHNLLSLNQHVWHWQYRWQYQQHFTNLVQILDNIRTNWFVHYSSIEGYIQNMDTWHKLYESISFVTTQRKSVKTQKCKGFHIRHK